MKQFFSYVFKFFDKLKKDHVNEYAAECAYFTILSFIPFIIIFITLIQYTSIDKSTIIMLLTSFIPNNMSGMIINIIEEVYSKSAGTISIALIVALWSAGKGFFSLCKGLRNIYKLHGESTNIFTRIRGTIYYLFKLRTVTLIIIMFIILLFVYRFMPRHKLKIKTQIFGAMFASIACYTLSWFFSIYVDVFKGFANTYGSLTTIILIMMWLYYCMYSILIGAEINTLIYEYKENKNKK